VTNSFTGTVSGQIQDKGQQVFNVKAYGAIGDGVTDDRADIQSALDAAAAAGGGVVFLPAGTYLIKRSLFLASKVTLCGAGIGVTTITKPASVKSLVTVNASAGATSVTVASSTGFEVGGAVNFYDTSNFEWDSTQGNITDITGNTITFVNEEGLGRTGLDASLQTVRSATATSSFPLIRNVEGSTNIGVRNLTLDQAQNANDPAPTSTTVGAQTNFTLATIHWVEAYYSLVENCELLNASGDAYSDQAQDGAGLTLTAGSIKTTKNTIRNCRIRNATRHGVHLGTAINGGFIINNEITSCAWFGMFYCAFTTYTIAQGNYIENCLTGFGGIDYRDYGNVISGNTIRGTTNAGIDAYTSGADGTGGRLAITGNVINPASGTGITLEHPDCTITGNTIELPNVSGAMGIQLRATADRTIIQGNTITAAAAGSGSHGIQLIANCDDVRIIGNVIKGMQNGINSQGVSRLIGIGNHLSGFTARAWWFSSATSTDCVIRDERNTFSTPVSEDSAPTRLVYEGLGDNGTADPASSGSWNGISGRRYNGTLVRWNSGDGEKVSIFNNGVGWTTLN
jgi:hypothetical protein